jgi:hypothetical protein
MVSKPRARIRGPAAALIAALGVGACVPLQYTRPSTSFAAMQEDRRECQLLAEREAFFGLPRPSEGPWYGPLRPRLGDTGAVLWRQQTGFDRLRRERDLADFCMRSRGYTLTPAS